MVLNKVLNLRRLKVEITGPIMYFDLKSCFFLIRNPELLKGLNNDPSFLQNPYLVCTNIDRHISPFLLNLNLKPLYSILGGSTTRAEPLTKKPKWVTLLSHPLYRWKICNHKTLVLSDIPNHESLRSIKVYIVSSLIIL